MVVIFNTRFLILFQGLLFLIFLLTTAFFNRFAADDYYFIGELLSKSPTELFNHLNTEWHGRWTSNFVIVHLMNSNSIPFFLTLFNLVTLFGLLFSLEFSRT